MIDKKQHKAMLYRAGELYSEKLYPDIVIFIPG
jgi:hypothetical protein